MKLQLTTHIDLNGQRGGAVSSVTPQDSDLSGRSAPARLRHSKESDRSAPARLRHNKNHAWDVKQLKIALNRLGFYTPTREGMTDELDPALIAAIKAFQRMKTIGYEPIIDQDSLTLRILNQELEAQHPEQAYIWRTVGDEKVRSSHKPRDGRRFTFGNPPEGGHPGEEYNCRCWMEPLFYTHNPWGETLLQEELKKQKSFDQTQNSPPNPYPDAIQPTLGPFDLVLGASVIVAGRGVIIAGSAIFQKGTRIFIDRATRITGQSVRTITALMRDTKWIQNTPRSQLQKKFKHAKDFGIKGNPNNKTLAQFKKALIDHVKSPDTVVIKGTYRGKTAIHYYNTKTGINVMRNGKNEFWSSWRLKPKRIDSFLKTGQLGKAKK